MMRYGLDDCAKEGATHASHAWRQVSHLLNETLVADELPLQGGDLAPQFRSLCGPLVFGQIMHRLGPASVSSSLALSQRTVDAAASQFIAATRTLPPWRCEPSVAV